MKVSKVIKKIIILRPFTFFFADDRLLRGFWDSSSDDGCVAVRSSSVEDCVATRGSSVDVCDDIIGGIDRGSSDVVT